jgi:hypothetical protein
MPDPVGGREAEALRAADRALDAVVRYFDGQIPPAGFPLASIVKPAADKVRAALDALRSSGSAAQNHEAGMQAAMAAGHANAHRPAVENMIAAYLAARFPQDEDHEEKN